MAHILLLLVFSFTLWFPQSLFSQTTGVSGINLEFYEPRLDPSGYFGVQGPRLVRPDEFYIQLSQSLALNHLFQISTAGSTIDLVDHIATTEVTTSVGLCRFFNLALSAPFHLYAREANVNTLQSFSTRGVGDIRIAAKLRLLEEGPHRPGLALLIQSSFPTGDEDRFLGTNHLVPGVTLIAGKEMKYASLALNGGVRLPQKKTVLGINFDDRFTFGGGIKVPLRFFDPSLSVMGEVRGHLDLHEVQIATAPIEYTVGIQKQFRNGLMLTAGGGGALNNAIGNPRFRGLLTLGYSIPLSKSKVEIERVSGLGLEAPLSEFHTIIYFHPGSHDPTPESRGWLLKVIHQIKSMEKPPFLVVEGHTDSTGSPSQNLSLSRHRAETIRALLLHEGIEASRIHTESFGSSRPAATNTTHQGRSLNRRVEVY